MENIYLVKFNSIFVMDVRLEKELVFTGNTSNVFMNFLEKEFNLIFMKEYGNL